MVKRISASELSEQITTPIPSEIAEQVIRLINKGAISKGDFLPTVTDLAKQLDVSLGTISAAWHILKKNQIVRGNGRQGITVINSITPSTSIRYSSDNKPAHLANFDLTNSVADPYLISNLSSALLHATTCDDINIYHRINIEDSLKKSVISSWPYRSEDFLATDSIFEAVAISVKTLTSSNPLLIIEQPTTIGLINLLNNIDCQVISIRYDNQGPILQDLKYVLEKKPAAFVFQPRVNSPSGIKTSPKRLKQLADLFINSQTIIIEQDVLGDFATIPAQSLGQYLPEQTIHIRSYIKAYGPDIGLAVLSAPKKLIQQIQDTRSFTHLGWSSRLLQQALAWLIKDPITQNGIRKARQVYRKRYQHLIKALKKRGVTETLQGDGFGIWLPVGSEALFIMALKERGILVMPSSQFCREETSHIRISTSLLNEDKIDYVANAIAKIIKPQYNYKQFHRW